MKKENIKKIIFILVALLLVSLSSVFAEETEIITDTPPFLLSEETQTENLVPEESFEIHESEQTENTEIENDLPLTIKSLMINDGNHILTVEDISLLEEGTITIIDTEGKTQEVNARSVLAVLYNLDETNDSFEISELIYYSSFNAFYVKCIRLEGDEKCNNWLYKINGESPSLGMDSHILSGDEEIEIYFSSFFGEPEPEKEENENSSIVVISSSSGSSRKKFSSTPEEEKIELLALVAPTTIPIPLQTLLGELSLRENSVKTEPVSMATKNPSESIPVPLEPVPSTPKELLASVGESDSSPILPVVALSGGVLGLALYLGKRYFMHKI